MSALSEVVLRFDRSAVSDGDLRVFIEVGKPDGDAGSDQKLVPAVTEHDRDPAEHPSAKGGIELASDVSVRLIGKRCDLGTAVVQLVGHENSPSVGGVVAPTVAGTVPEEPPTSGTTPQQVAERIIEQMNRRSFTMGRLP